MGPEHRKESQSLQREAGERESGESRAERPEKRADGAQAAGAARSQAPATAATGTAQGTQGCASTNGAACQHEPLEPQLERSIWEGCAGVAVQLTSAAAECTAIEIEHCAICSWIFTEACPGALWCGKTGCR